MVDLNHQFPSDFGSFADILENHDENQGREKSRTSQIFELETG